MGLSESALFTTTKASFLSLLSSLVGKYDVFNSDGHTLGI
jgi:hypothetical protein